MDVGLGFLSFVLLPRKALRVFLPAVPCQVPLLFTVKTLAFFALFVSFFSSGLACTHGINIHGVKILCLSSLSFLSVV